MHEEAFQIKIMLAAQVTDPRPGPARLGRGVNNRGEEGRRGSPDAHLHVAQPLETPLPKGGVSVGQEAVVGRPGIHVRRRPQSP